MTAPTINASASTARSSAVPAGNTMCAVVAPRYGGPEVLEIRTIDRPAAGDGEVVVRVVAAGISRAALHLLTGTPYLLRLAGFGVRAPKQPVVGIEVSGVVEAVGAGVTRFAVGDEVFGYGSGAVGELAVAKEAKLAHKPASLSFEEAAAMVDSASTALQAVVDHGDVQSGQRVLVLGGSGGVGSFAVQVAKLRGAEVTATASTAKVDFVRTLGADQVIDHRLADPLDVGSDRYDVIIDVGGNRPVRSLRRALAEHGTLVFVGGEGGGSITGGFQRQLLAPLRGVVGNQHLKTFVSTEHHDVLGAVAALADDGLRPAIDRVHPLADAALAFERMEAGEIRGKDVVRVAESNEDPGEGTSSIS